MFGFLRKESSAVAAPVSGRCIRLEEVADKVFSSKMMGDGFAVIPKDDTAVAPVIRFDREGLEKKGIDMTTMVIFTGGYEKDIDLEAFGQEVGAGEAVLEG